MTGLRRRSFVLGALLILWPLRADALSVYVAEDGQVIGPFDNEGRAGFAAEQPPEAARTAPFDASARYRGREREVGWRAYPNVSELGYVNFDAVFRPYENTCGFAVTTVHADRARPVSLNFGAGGAIKVYWNGTEV